MIVSASRDSDPKVQIAIRVDPDVLAALKTAGPGWPSRMNAALRAAMPG